MQQPLEFESQWAMVEHHIELFARQRHMGIGGEDKNGRLMSYGRRSSPHTISDRSRFWLGPWSSCPRPLFSRFVTMAFQSCIGGGLHWPFFFFISLAFLPLLRSYIYPLIMANSGERAHRGSGYGGMLNALRLRRLGMSMSAHGAASTQQWREAHRGSYYGGS